MGPDENRNKYLREIHRRREKKKRTNYEYIGHKRTSYRYVECSSVPSNILGLCLKECQPGGDGQHYEHFVMDAMGKVLSPMVDERRVVLHGPSVTGRYDIRFRFRADMLNKFPFWHPWWERYSVEKVLVEVKNTIEPVDRSAVEQLWGYIQEIQRGKLGFLVSRNGFTESAFEKIRFLRSEAKALILPISNWNLRLLLRLREKNEELVLRYLCVRADDVD